MEVPHSQISLGRKMKSIKNSKTSPNFHLTDSEDLKFQAWYRQDGSFPEKEFRNEEYTATFKTSGTPSWLRSSQAGDYIKDSLSHARRSRPPALTYARQVSIGRVSVAHLSRWSLIAFCRLNLAVTWEASNGNNNYASTPELPAPRTFLGFRKVFH